ncbi:MAG: hypothetical protein AAGA42_10850 [Actinomycetota bacterium]
MSDHDGTTIECATCPAAGTTACNDCIVTHVLANDDGPIELHVAPPLTPEQRAIELFLSAGMLDDEGHLVDPREFEAAARRHPAAHVPVR